MTKAARLETACLNLTGSARFFLDSSVIFILLVCKSDQRIYLMSLQIRLTDSVL